EGLIEFFDSEMKRSPAGKEYERISRLVKDISDSISLCDVIRFEESLKRMRDWLSKERRHTSYIKLFVKYIKEDYGSLLSDDVRLLDEILWCNKKGFIQQALTLIESRMPEVICSSDLFYVDWSQEIGDPAVSLERMVDKAKKKEVEKNSYILLVWAREKHDADLSVLLRKDKKRYLIDSIGSKEIIEDNPFDRKVIWCEGDFNIKFFNSSMSSGDGIIPMSIRYSSEDADKSRYTIIINEEKKDAFISFINIHFWLKNQRNKVNHVNTSYDREDATGIGRVINLYVDRACKLGL
ncbi:MAG: hypothetical protein IJS24_04970, partial [Eubacterium sp.]|nr:hypothetical protein [Eubacterium sp.]